MRIAELIQSILKMHAKCAIILDVKAKNKKTLIMIFTEPVNGNLEWGKIEALFLSLGCRIIEGKGSSVTFEKNHIRAYFHRPHPKKAALRYRVKDARIFLERIGVKP